MFDLQGGHRSRQDFRRLWTTMDLHYRWPCTSPGSYDDFDPYRIIPSLLAQDISSAVGVSAIVYGTLGTLTTWCKARRATAYGIATSDSSFGDLIFPVLINQLKSRVGFRWTMRAVAFLVLFGEV
jgi:hypothetical protein